MLLRLLRLISARCFLAATVFRHTRSFLHISPALRSTQWLSLPVTCASFFCPHTCHSQKRSDLSNAIEWFASLTWRIANCSVGELKSHGSRSPRSIHTVLKVVSSVLKRPRRSCQRSMQPGETTSMCKDRTPLTPFSCVPHEVSSM